MNVIKLCRKENIAIQEEDHSGFCLGSLVFTTVFFFPDLPLVMSCVDPV